MSLQAVAFRFLNTLILRHAASYAFTIRHRTSCYAFIFIDFPLLTI